MKSVNNNSVKHHSDPGLLFKCTENDNGNKTKQESVKTESVCDVFEPDSVSGLY